MNKKIIFSALIFCFLIGNVIAAGNFTDEQIKNAFSNYKNGVATDEEKTILMDAGLVPRGDSLGEAEGYIEVLDGVQYYVDAKTGEKTKILTSEEATQINSGNTNIEEILENNLISFKEDKRLNYWFIFNMILTCINIALLIFFFLKKK